MVHLIVVCGRREETVAGVFSTCVLGIFYKRIFLYQGYDLWKNRKAHCMIVGSDLRLSLNYFEFGGAHQINMPAKECGEV